MFFYPHCSSATAVSCKSLRGFLLPICGYAPLSILLLATVLVLLLLYQRGRGIIKMEPIQHGGPVWSVSGQRHPDRWQQPKHLLAPL